MNFELVDLRAFLAILELRSFNKAARMLNLSQPVLSRRIQALESLFGGALLERTTRSVMPSALGRELEPVLRRMVGDFDSAIMSLNASGQRARGQISIACIPTAAFYFLPKIIQIFRKEYPLVQIRILDLSANEGLEAVARGEAEFGINFMGASSQNISFTPLLTDPFILACRSDCPLATKERVTWDEVAAFPLISVSRVSANRLVLDFALAKTGRSLNWLYEVHHITTSLGLVEAGLGVSILPRLASPGGDHPAIVTRSLGDPEITRTIGVVERRASRLSAAAARFRDLLVGLQTSSEVTHQT